MSSYRTELRIPVEVDGHKTFGRHFRTTDEESQFERPSSRFAGSTPWHKPLGYPYSKDGSSCLVNSDDWFDQMRRRFDDRRQRWDADVRRMRQDFFSHRPDEADTFRCNSPLSDTLSEHSKLLTKPQRTSQSFWSGYENGPDNSLLFVANFDAAGYTPGEIEVAVKDNELQVIAKSEYRDKNSSSRQDYTRSLTLPRGVDGKQASAALTVDGVLTVTCAVQPPPFPKDRTTSDEIKLNMDPHKSSQTGSSSFSQPLRVERILTKKTEAKPGQFTYQENVKKPKFCLEIQIGEDYSPNEIKIRTLNGKVYISARHEEHLSNRTAIREFSKEYDIPVDIDPESLEASLKGETLYIESYQ